MNLSVRTREPRTAREELRALTAAQVRGEIRALRGGYQSETSKAYLLGWLACAMSAGAINLHDKGAAELAIVEKRLPEHLGEWWLTI